MPTALARRNRILATLSKDDFAVVRPELLRWSLAPNDVLFEAGDTLDKIVLPCSGIVSLIAPRATSRIEVAMVGCEGFVGISLLAGGSASPFRCVVRSGGEALCIPASRLRGLIEGTSALREALWGFFRDISGQLAEGIIAASTGTIPQRLARWILMGQDRLDNGSLPMTHSLASERLGVRRPSVTAGLQALERGGLIRSERGMVTVIDRAGLIALAGDIYAPPEWSQA